MQIEPDALIKTEGDLVAVISRITFVRSTLDFKWRFKWASVSVFAEGESAEKAVGHHCRHGWLIWAEFERPDINTGETGIGRGRDEIIWRGTTLSGVVKTCYVLVDMLIRHELMEGFKFDGIAPFNPHNTIPELLVPSTLRGAAPAVDTYAILKGKSQEAPADGSLTKISDLAAVRCPHCSAVVHIT